MIALKPLPDELERSYMGRLMRFNGIAVEKEFVQHMARWMGVEKTTRRELSCVDLLSRVANLETRQFVRQHTLLPLRRSFTSYLPELQHGDPRNQGMLNLGGMRSARPGAYFCLQCVESDHKQYGMSYWRRDHQVPGVSQCSKHQKPLQYVDDRSAFLDPPSKYRTESHSMLDEYAKIDTNHPGVQRFVALSRELLEREKPFDVKAARIVLRDRAISFGLCTHFGKSGQKKRLASKPLLSDFVLNNFPNTWLLTVMPPLVEKQPGHHLDQMDGVLYLSTSASSVTPYILACCVLFDSVDDALNALINFHPSDRGESANKASEVINPNELREAYVRAKGQHGRIFEEFSASKWSVISALEVLGLPNLLARGNRSLLEAAILFFVRQMSIAESTATAGVPVDALEALVRQGGFQLQKALEEMAATKRTRPTTTLRARPKSAIEAGIIASNFETSALPI